MPATEIGLCRIAQEPVPNQIRPTAPTRNGASVNWLHGEWRPCVADDGKGFDNSQSSPGMGIGQTGLECQVFGDQLQIESQGGRTVVNACVPPAIPKAAPHSTPRAAVGPTRSALCATVSSDV